MSFNNKNNPTLTLTKKEMQDYGYTVVDAIVEHFETLNSKPPVALATRKEMDELLQEPAPEDAAGAEGDPAAVLADVKIRDVPVFFINHWFEDRSFHIDHTQSFNVAAFIGCSPEFSVRCKFQPVISDRLGAVGQFLRCTIGNVDQIKLIVGDRNIIEHQQFGVIW